MKYNERPYKRKQEGKDNTQTKSNYFKYMY